MEERELVILILSAVAFGLAINAWQRLSAIPGLWLLLLAGLVWLIGYAVTVTETLLPFPPMAADVMEHGAYAATSLCLLVWVVRHWGQEAPS